MHNHPLGAAHQDFESQAPNYDLLIPKLIPYYHQQTQVLLNLIPFASSDAIAVLDLGIGTGTLAEAVLQRFPQSRVHGIDFSEQMLEGCRQRLDPYGDRLTLEQMDFSHYQSPERPQYNLVISGLAIHHISDDRKKHLFQALAQSLQPEGTLLIRDLVKAPTQRLESLYDRLWRDFIRSNGEDDALWYGKHREKDQPAYLAEQLQWLEQSGLHHVDCHWKYWQFAIFGGRHNGCAS